MVLFRDGNFTFSLAAAQVIVTSRVDYVNFALGTYLLLKVNTYHILYIYQTGNDYVASNTGKTHFFLYHKNNIFSRIVA